MVKFTTNAKSWHKDDVHYIFVSLTFPWKVHMFWYIFPIKKHAMRCCMVKVDSTILSMFTIGVGLQREDIDSLKHPSNTIVVRCVISHRL